MYGTLGLKGPGSRVQGVDTGDCRFRDVRNYSNAGGHGCSVLQAQ